MTHVRNNLKRKALIVLFACLTALVLAGCAGAPQGESSSTGTAASEPESRTLVDAYGRSVELPAEVVTAATVGSGARFVVYAGAQDKLIAATEMDTPASPARPYTEVHADLFAGLPTTSNGNHLNETTVDTEKLLELHPDVIVSSRSAEECDALQDSIGIPVVGITYQGQLFTDNVYTSIEVVGDALGTGEHARSVVAAMKDWAADLDRRTASIPDADKPSAYVGAVNYKGAKSFTGTYASYPALDAVHANNVADALGQKGAVEVSLEQVGEWNPDVMFLNAGNMDLMKKDYEDNKEFFGKLTAFQNGALYTQPSFNYNGTNVEMGICDAYFCGATLYPEAFADVDLAKKYDDVFSTMLGANYYEQMKSLGIDFKRISFE